MPFPGISGLWPQQNTFVPLRSNTLNATARMGGFTIATLFYSLRTGNDRLRVQVSNPWSSTIVVNAAYIGRPTATGVVYNFATTPTLLTWNGGSTSFTLGPGQTLLSDILEPYFVQTNMLLTANIAGTRPSSYNIGYAGAQPNSRNVTFTSYAPGVGCRITAAARNTTTSVITFTTSSANNFRVNDTFYFSNGTISDLTAGTIYFVKTRPTTTTFTLSTTLGGPVFTRSTVPTLSGTIYVGLQTAGQISRAAGYPAFVVGTSPNNGTQTLFSDILGGDS
jgi:hypothetical protein